MFSERERTNKRDDVAARAPSQAQDGLGTRLGRTTLETDLVVNSTRVCVSSINQFEVIFFENLEIF